MKFPEHTCPRCLGGVPTPSERGEYPGAISRTDNKTEICSECGVREAFECLTEGVLSQDDWHIWSWIALELSALARRS